MAWQWTSVDDAVVAANPTARPGAYQDTPLMANGVLYTVTSLGQVAALDPGTGVARWVFDPGSWKSGRPGNLGFVHRGLAYWTDGTKERLLLGTGDAYLLAIDARTGGLDSGFGDAGRVDLMAGVARATRGTTFSNSSAPIVCRDVVVVGASVHDGPSTKEWPRGDVTGFDVRTGKRLWTFRSIPEKGALGYDTWSGDAAEYTGSTNVWTTMSADEGSASSTCPSARPPTTSTAATGRARTCSPSRSSPSTRAPAPASGTSRPCTTACGTTTCRRRRRWWTSPWTAGASRPWPR